MYTTQSAATALGINAKHVRRLARKLLPGVADSGRWEFNDEHLEILRQSINPKPESVEWLEADGGPILRVSHLVAYNSDRGRNIRMRAQLERAERRQKLIQRINEVCPR